MAVSEKNSDLPSRVRFLEAALCILVAALVLLPLSPAVQRFPFRDSGMFLYAGWRLRPSRRVQAPETDTQITRESTS